MATAVRGVIMDASALDISSTPPSFITISISMPTPVTMISVDQETVRNTSFSSAAFKATRRIPTAKEIRPTLRSKKALAMMTTKKPSSVRIWLRLNLAVDSCSVQRSFTLWLLKRKKMATDKTMVVTVA